MYRHFFKAIELIGDKNKEGEIFRRKGKGEDTPEIPNSDFSLLRCGREEKRGDGERKEKKRDFLQLADAGKAGSQKKQPFCSNYIGLYARHGRRKKGSLKGGQEQILSAGTNTGFPTPVGGKKSKGGKGGKKEKRRHLKPLTYRGQKGKKKPRRNSETHPIGGGNPTILYGDKHYSAGRRQGRGKGRVEKGGGGGSVEVPLACFQHLVQGISLAPKIGGKKKRREDRQSERIFPGPISIFLTPFRYAPTNRGKRKKEGLFLRRRKKRKTGGKYIGIYANRQREKRN